ncbi:hypothetical protein M2475_002228 [Breznakia sp. PF5-3]|uniref:DUF4304 domain-containing protein n=1 Tax=unclassified Breznakia TaxID=2623764 RepID=UPI002405DDD2|nr:MULTISPECIES: DUF4304 domain-containing protein [unclassified Breznakia]MDF9825860.1 hypothetical protein [Breznakia sp. PM6-1]MDF9836646.1 hypothetical protein [Breznakia sp. PF5-3]MDF9838900.1 hypothetical protein [Breznakia sp. PFB2-8]MDF9860933.1 hypothetical protein [Breznakia sp. PH5-24]
MDTKIYNKQMRIFTKKMKELGFQKWKSTFFVRRTEYDVVEEIHIQKRSDGKEVTGNYSFSLLYQPYQAIKFETSSRFGRLIYGKDHWWPLETEADCEKAFDDFYNIIKEKIIPEFNSFHDVNSILELTTKKMMFYQYYFKVILNLYYNNYKIAQETYNYLNEHFNEVNKDEDDSFFLNQYKEKMKEIPVEVFSNSKKCKAFLTSNMETNIKIIKYPFK